MTSRIRWSNTIRRFLTPLLRDKVATVNTVSISMETLEDRTVPAYLPLLGQGQSDGYPLSIPGPITGSIEFSPQSDLPINGEFFESVNAEKANGLTLSGFNGAKLYNTQGPVITLSGGKLNLGSGIVYGRSDSYLGTVTPGNEILANGNGTLGVYAQDALNNLTVTVESGSQTLLGDPSANNPFNTFASSFTIAGEGVGSNGVIQSVNGTELVTGGLTANSSVKVGATTGSTLILNGPVNGVRSANAFDGFTITGGGTVILDNVLPVATVSALTPGSTSDPLLQFQVKLSEIPQADLTINSLTVTNGTVTGFNKIDNLTYTYDVTSTIPNGQAGSVTAQVPQGQLTDHAYLSNLPSNISSILVDRQAPTASGTFPNITQALASQTSTTITVKYSDGSGVGIDPSTIAASNLLVTGNNGTTLTVGSGPTFNASTGEATYSLLPGSTWAQYSQNGPVTVTVSLVANGVKDLVGNGVQAGVVNTFVVSTQPPVITVNGGLPVNASNTDNVITLTSNNDIASFDLSKFTATNGTIKSVNQTNSTTLEVTVSALPGAIQQVILLNIASGAITDTYGNSSSAVTPSPSYTFDTLPPTAVTNTPSINITASTIPTTDNFVDFNVSDPSYQNVLGSGVNISTILLSSIVVKDPNGTPITVTNLFKDPLGGQATIPASQFPGGSWANAVQGQYTITIENYYDNAGNLATPVQIGTFLVATTKPTVTLSANPTTGINDISTVIVDFSSAGNIPVSGLTLDDFFLIGQGTISNLQQIGANQYALDVTPTVPNATISLVLPAGTVTDSAGNDNLTSNTLDLQFALTKPIPSLTGLNQSPTNNKVISGILTFSEPVNLLSGLQKVQLSDLNISSGNVASFTSSNTSDGGLTFPFQITLTNEDQSFTANAKAGIATAQAAPNSPNIAGANNSILLVVTNPTAAINTPIAPINSNTGSNTQIVVPVSFTTGLNIDLDLIDPATALVIKKGTTTLTYSIESIDSQAKIINYLVDPPVAGWDAANSQGQWTISILANKIYDAAGNSVQPGVLGNFQVATSQPGSSLSFPGANDPDYTLVWINSSSPTDIVVKVSPTKADGSPITPSDLNTSIVPTIADFQVTGFTIKSVSGWQNISTAPFVLVTISPLQDVVGDPTSIGPVSLLVKANAFYDIYGNGNSQADPNNLPPNGQGYLSMVGIDRVAPIYTTTGLTPTQLNSTQISDPVVVKLTYSDATSGLDNNSLKPENLILTLGADPSNQAIITGQVDPNDSNTYIYTLNPISGTWADGTYTLKFTSTATDKVYDTAFNELFNPTSSNGIQPGVVTNNGQTVSFTVDTQSPTVSSATIIPSGTTNTSPLNATVVFDKAVQGFTPGAIGLNNATMVAGSFQSSDNITFTFQLMPTSDQTEVSFSVLTGQGVTDTFGNPLLVGATSNTVIFDAVGPTGIVTQAPLNINLASGTSSNTNTFQVTYTDPAGIDPTSITTSNYDVTNGATITGVTFDPATGIATYTITASGASWSASPQGTYLITPSTVTANLPKDTLGNIGTPPSTSFDVDTVAPVVSNVVFADPNPTNNSVLTVNIEFSKPVTFGDPGTDFVNLFTVTNATVNTYSQTGPTTYKVTLSPVSVPAGERLVTFQVNANAATDNAGNPNTASSVADITFDNLGPQLTVLPQGLTNNATNVQTITVKVTVDPASAYNFAAQIQAGIVLANATYVPNSFAPLSGSNSEYSFQITATNPGLVTVGIGADAFDDALGNANIQTTTTYQYRPALTVAVTSPDVQPGDSTDLPSIQFEALFNGPITSFNANNFFTLTNATVTNLTQDPQNPAKFTFTVNPTGAGAVSVQIKAGAATDDLGQQNEASTPFNFTYNPSIVVTADLSFNATEITSLKAIVINLNFSQPVTGLDATNFVSKFTIGGATLDPNSFSVDPTGQFYKFLLLPTAVPGSSAPVAVSLQFNGNQVTPPNQASNLIQFTYINQAGAIGLGVGGQASLTRADGTILPVNVFPGFQGGVRVATGNYASTNSGTLDLLAGAGVGGGPAVKVINGATGATALSFYAFQSDFVGGVYVASGDVNNDGFNDYVISAGLGGGPNVKVFSGNPADVVGGIPKLLASFYAYSANFTGGVTVAVADINADGYADVVTGAGPGGGPHVKVFSGASLANNQTLLLASFYSGNPANTAGLFVAAGDLGGDGSIQIITGTGAGVSPLVSVFTLLQQGTTNNFVVDTTQTKTFQPYDALFTGGVRVAAINTSQSTGGSINLVTTPGAGGGPNVRVFDPLNNYALIDSFFFPDDPNYTGGLYIG